METLAAGAHDAIQRATAALDAGELVIVPGDLCYLLVADALDDEAVARLFDATSRAADDAPLLLVSGFEDLHHVAYAGPAVRALADAHWPGPATLALKPRPWLPDAILAGGDAVRVSAPAQAGTRQLARHFGPLAATRARAPGGPEPLDLRAVGGVARHAALALDAGALPGGDATAVPTAPQQ